jgi:hypothetical protein
MHREHWLQEMMLYQAQEKGGKGKSGAKSGERCPEEASPEHQKQTKLREKSRTQGPHKHHCCPGQGEGPRFFTVFSQPTTTCHEDRIAFATINFLF